MDDDDKKVLKLVQKSKEKPPEDNTPGVTPDDLLKEGIGNYESLILVGWSGDHFKVSWNLGLTPDEVYVLLDAIHYWFGNDVWYGQGKA